MHALVAMLLTFGAAPPVGLTATQEARLLAREALLREIDTDVKARRFGRVASLMGGVLKVEREVYGPRHVEIVGTLYRLADLHRIWERWEEAADCHREILAIRRRLYPEGHYLTTDARLELADAAREARLAPAERRDLAEALRLNRDSFALQEKGEFARAVPLAARALEIRGRVQGTGHPLYARALNNLAALHLALADHAAARDAFALALALRRRTLGEMHPDHAVSLGNLASVYSAAGDHRGALPLTLRALAIRRALFGEGDEALANSLNNLGALYMELGDAGRARRLFGLALRAFTATHGEGHNLTVTCLQNSAAALDALGDPEGGLRLLHRALALRKAPGTSPADLALCHNNLAVTLDRLGRHDEARHHLVDALAIYKRVLGERHTHHAVTLGSLGMLDLVRDDHAAALPALGRSFALLNRSLGQAHPSTQRARVNLAVALFASGDVRAALALADEAADLSARAGAGTAAHANTLGVLAQMRHRIGRPGAGLALIEQSLHLTRRAVGVDAAHQSERQMLAANASLRYRLDVRLSMRDEPPLDAYGHVLTWKGAVFASQQARRLFARLGDDPAARELAEATRSLAIAASRADAASRHRAADLRRLKEEKEATLAERSAPFRESLAPPSPAAVAAALPPGTALIDLLVYDGHDPARPPRGQSECRRVAAWVVRAGRCPVRVDLGPARPIEEAVGSWRKAIESGGDSPAAGAALRRLVWLPVEGQLGGARTVLVSPDGPLAGLPFGALPGSKAGSRLLEEVALAVLPIPRMLPGRPRADVPPSLLAVGDATFGSGAGRWAPLRATGPEADAAVAAFRAAFPRAASPAKLAGPAASTSAVRRTMPGTRFLHLATHGFYTPPRPAPPRPSSLLTEPREAAGVGPGLSSGLVLAGANRPAADDDGIMTALEIAEMDLWGVELAVLSACQTGLGKEAAGEGLLGLQRAFAVAGCGSVVSSLWSVDDAATGVLMERFYHHLWRDRLPKVEALRQAQLDVMRHPEWVEARVKALSAVPGLRGRLGKAVAGPDEVKARRSPPAWWAAWQLSGDWR